MLDGSNFISETRLGSSGAVGAVKSTSDPELPDAAVGSRGVYDTGPVVISSSKGLSADEGFTGFATSVAITAGSATGVNGSSAGLQAAGIRISLAQLGHGMFSPVCAFSH